MDPSSSLLSTAESSDAQNEFDLGIPLSSGIYVIDPFNFQHGNPQTLNTVQNDGENGGENDNPETNEAVKEAFEMVDIVYLILKYLNGKSLKSACMVGKIWNEEGMKLFLKHNFIRVPLNFSSKSEEDKKEMIEELNPQFSRFAQIPHVIINRLCDIPILRDLDILNEAKHVKLNPKVDEEESELRYDAEYFQCLEKLMKEYPNLTSLTWEDDMVSSHKFMKLWEETQKCGLFTVSHLTIVIYSLDQIQSLEYFANSGVRVINLELQVCQNDGANFNHLAAQLIEKILHSSKDCLKDLKLSVYGRGFTLSKNIPVMTMLESLTIEISFMPPTLGFHDPLAFPSGFRFSQNCPNLKTYEMILHSRQLLDENYLDRVFASTGLATSVKNLKLHFTGFDRLLPLESTFKLDKTLQTFSGLDTLQMTYRREVNLNSVWKLCPKLKSLKLQCFSRNYPSFNMELLAQMTGYSVDFIQTIWTSSVDLATIEIPPQTQPSILNLQDLEELSMLHDLEQTYLDEVSSNFIPWIRKLALCDMPKVKDYYMFY